MASQSDLEVLAHAENDRLTKMGPSTTNGTTPLSPSPAPSSDSKIANEVEKSNHLDQNPVHKVISLELRYIRLLKQRIAILEEQEQMYRSAESNYRLDLDQDQDEVYQKDNDEEQKKTNGIIEDNGSSNRNPGTNKIDSSETSARRRAPINDGLKNDTANRTGNETASVDVKYFEAKATGKASEPSRVSFNDRRYDDKGIQVIVDTSADISSSKEAPADNVEEENDYAFMWSRVFDTVNKYLHTEVEIQSKPLVNLLKVNMTHHIEFPHHGNVIRLRSPFRPIVHSWTRLLGEAEPHPDESDDQKTSREDLKRLMDRVSLSIELEQYFQDFDPAKPSETVTFDLLWTNFPPGCLVFSRNVMQKEQVLILQHSEEDEHKDKQRLMLT